MSINKANSGWQVDSQPGGRGGKRFRKTFKTQAEAKAYEAWLKTQANQHEKWQPEKRDTRRLSELIDLWHTHHGSGLKAGANTYSRLKLACESMGNPVADRFNVPRRPPKVLHLWPVKLLHPGHGSEMLIAASQ